MRSYRRGAKALLLAVSVTVLLTPAVRVSASHGGEFAIDYKAARPTLYPTTFPITQGCPASGGQAAEPLPGAQHATGQESLTPSEMVLGQIVAFEFEITVGGSAPADSSIEFRNRWDTVTTPSGDFGYAEDFLVYCAFVDTADPSASDSESDAAATVTSALVGTQIQGTFEVVGLDPGDVVVVEAWLVLENRIPPGTSGNVQSRILDARTLTPDEDTISTGAQTIPILRVQDFLSAIIVRKLIDPASDQTATFEFSGDVTATLGHGEISDPVVVDDGTYSVMESVPEGWSTPTVECDDEDSSGADDEVTFNVSSETVICTFSNIESPPTTTTSTTTTTTTASSTTTIATTTTLQQTTTSASTPTTLPYTGSSSMSLAGLALVLLAMGGLLFAHSRGRQSS